MYGHTFRTHCRERIEVDSRQRREGEEPGSRETALEGPVQSSEHGPRWKFCRLRRFGPEERGRRVFTGRVSSIHTGEKGGIVLQTPSVVQKE